MQEHVEITTRRLVLRRWRESDREPWAALCADTVVMRHFESPLTREQADAMFERVDEHFDEHGFGLWAVERGDEGDFIGFVGLHVLDFEADFTPAVEIGWRLARHAWGRGYATEAARAVLDHAFGQLGLDEVVAMTVPANGPSLRVMERLGMERDLDGDFEHPKVAAGHPLRHHVLYRIRRG